MIEHTRLFKEIHEQPAVLARVIDREKNTLEKLAAQMRKQQITHVVIAARGTSDNAGRYAQYLLGAANQLVVSLTTPSLFSIYKQPPRFGRALVLGISQSGKSPDIVSVLAEARNQGVLTAAITNFPDSDLANQGDFVIELNAGEEKSIAATKTYTSELMAIALLSQALDPAAQKEALLNQIPELAEKTLKIDREIADRVERYRYMRECVVIGRGYNYATTFELALKLKELTYTLVAPYSSADFLHGPLALIHQGFPAMVIAPAGAVMAEMTDFMSTLVRAGAELIVISDHDPALAFARVGLKLPVSVPEWLSPLITILPGQVFAMRLAHVRDLDVDNPRGLSKVTETR